MTLMPSHNPNLSPQFIEHMGKGRPSKGYRKTTVSLPEDVYNILDSQPDSTRSDAIIRIIREWESAEKIRKYFK